MNRKICAVFSLLALLPTAVLGEPDPAEFESGLITGSQEQLSPAQRSIIDLEKQLSTAYSDKAQQPFEDALKQLNFRYGVAVEKQMGASESTVAKLAVRRELKLLESGDSPLAADGTPKPSEVEEIRKLRATYAAQYDKLILERATRTQALLEVFSGELAKLEPTLPTGGSSGELEFITALRARLADDSGRRDLAQILAGAEPGSKEIVQAPPEAGEKPVEDASIAAALPRTEKALERYLKHTIWKLTSAGKDSPVGEFRFRGDGRMSMPWHSVRWWMIDSRSVMMDNGDWQFRIDFSKDMKTLEARGSAGKGKDGWDGTFSRRITSAIPTTELEQIVGSRKWRLTMDEGQEGVVEFGPKLVKSETLKLPWRKWKVLDGILVISDTKKVISEFYLKTADKPHTLSGLTSKQSKWRLVEVGGD